MLGLIRPKIKKLIKDDDGAVIELEEVLEEVKELVGRKVSID